MKNLFITLMILACVISNILLIYSNLHNFDKLLLTLVFSICLIAYSYALNRDNINPF